MLARILEEVGADGYPPHRPAAASRLIRTPDELGAFVFERQGAPVGHVAVHRSTAPILMERAASALACSPDDLAVVARLFVAPSARRDGAASALVDGAVELCRAQQRTPILDVWERLEGAIALYERSGWTRVATEEFAFGSSCTDACVHAGDRIRSHLYVLASPSSS